MGENIYFAIALSCTIHILHRMPQIIYDFDNSQMDEIIYFSKQPDEIICFTKKLITFVYILIHHRKIYWSFPYLYFCMGCCFKSYFNLGSRKNIYLWHLFFPTASKLCTAQIVTVYTQRVPHLSNVNSEKQEETTITRSNSLVGSLSSPYIFMKEYAWYDWLTIWELCLLYSLMCI